MNIYDLEKQATPGPLEIVRFTDRLDDVRLREGILCFDRGSPDAKLLIHCRNHFMEALAALKEEHENHNDHHDAGCGGTRLCPVCKLLVKLEEAK